MVLGQGSTVRPLRLSHADSPPEQRHDGIVRPVRASRTNIEAVTDVATRLATAVESGDADHVLAVVEAADWRGMASADANAHLRQVALYGYSGRTRRYADAVRAMRAGGCIPDLASCALLEDNERAVQILTANPGVAAEADESGATALHYAGGAGQRGAGRRPL